MQTLLLCLSPSYALKLKNHLSGTYNTSSKHAISLQYFFLSSAIKAICMRTASLNLPSAPYFAPVVNIYFFITYDSLARLQEMVSVYRRPVSKRARIISLHRPFGMRQRCSVCLSTPTAWVEQEAQSQNHQQEFSSRAGCQPALICPSPLLPAQGQFPSYAWGAGRLSSHLSPPAAHFIPHR